MDDPSFHPYPDLFNDLKGEVRQRLDPTDRCMLAMTCKEEYKSTAAKDRTDLLRRLVVMPIAPSFMHAAYVDDPGRPVSPFAIALVHACLELSTELDPLVARCLPGGCVGDYERHRCESCVQAAVRSRKADKVKGVISGLYFFYFAGIGWRDADYFDVVEVALTAAVYENVPELIRQILQCGRSLDWSGCIVADPRPQQPQLTDILLREPDCIAAIEELKKCEPLAGSGVVRENLLCGMIQRGWSFDSIRERRSLFTIHSCLTIYIKWCVVYYRGDVANWLWRIAMGLTPGWDVSSTSTLIAKYWPRILEEHPWPPRSS